VWLGSTRRVRLSGSTSIISGAHGYLLKKGIFTNIDVPGAMVGSTNPTAINAQGDIVGTYSVCTEDNGCSPHGFLLSK
jgi:hypothetical protein